METATTQISTRHGSILMAREWLCPNARAVFVLVHGMESHSEWFSEIASGLVARGSSVIAYDRPGSGLTPPSPEVFRYVRCAADLFDVLEYARTLSSNVHLVGMSWGGLLALAVSADGIAGRIASVTLLTPAIFSKPVGLAFAAQVASGLLLRTPRFVELPVTPEEFTKIPKKLAFVRGDKLRAKAASPVFLWETLILQRRVRRLKMGALQVPLTVALAETDSLIDNDRTAALANDLGGRVRHFPGTLHSLALEDPLGIAALLWERIGLSS